MAPRAFLPSLMLGALAAAPLSGGVLGDDLNQEESDDYVSLPLLRLSVDAGLSRWIRPSDTGATSALRAYQDDQQSGHDLSAEAVCYFLPRGGFGITWIWFLSRTRAADLIIRAGGPAHDVEERVSITYIGPSFWSRLIAGRYGLAHVGFGAGYLGVLDTWTDNGTANKVEAMTYAIVTSLGWDYSLYRFLGLGISGRFVFSNVKEWTYNGEKVRVEDPDDSFMWYNVPLYRLELNAGIRIFL